MAMAEDIREDEDIEEATSVDFDDDDQGVEIEMSSDEEAQKAIEAFNGADLMGRPLKVNEAQPQQPRSGGFGGGRGGRGGGGGRGRY